ncbi:thiamine-phosphate kinase [Methyloversatilis sp.]|uniref:thiamine-phosphate kinase n=1 Tax=Methyloversatilis sp. TaxID=2569862 RepID=UPI0027375927|nr:thiamine-phosphate kinase [Methyloversatilis sp.]MDP2870817.1 thiamine-phosphate kinase [Methyloversatilis sp.]MDP3456206.1 thiamine-phosphate kinase [Methyloversatilis sp.]MDP3577158.1 thiamine-phosphate kinase [Methyloversatilis sp.]
MSPEFELIRRHFVRPMRGGVLGPGDDCALVRPSPGCELAITCDMLVSGTHFLPDTDPRRLGWKTLAVNLSDLAAMGATPRWVTLALSLPEVDDAWLGAFADGFFDCAYIYGVDLIGGDTTRGPLTLCVTAFGEAATGKALRRSGAQDGDDIWVSGQPGRAALGLADALGSFRLKDAHRDDCISALEKPLPRVALGRALQDVASAAIDVSDGLLADLGHIAAGSGLHAVVEDAALPWAALRATCDDEATVRRALLAGGDDYELLFCASLSTHDALRQLSESLSLPLTRIGAMRAGRAGDVSLIDAQGCELPVAHRGYDHFS